MELPSLPIQEVLAALKAALASGSAILAAPPGSGKTTIVPLALLDESWLAGRKILILEPRRLAARAAAARMSSLLGDTVGQTVGYQIRFDRKISERTRVEVLTEGILTRRIQHDPDLTGVGLIIFDEFHERSVHADLALALCLDLCQVKNDLRLLVMSATLDTAAIAALLGHVPVITGRGRSHDVHIEYLRQEPRRKISDTTVTAVRRVVKEQPGDLLVFLPGSGEIREACQKLQDDEAFRNILILPLFGEMSQKEQDQAILPDCEGRRRIILATSIAETSLTIEGIRCVVDSGWSRRPLFDPANGLTRLTTVRVSRAVATQRAGRAGRLGPGYCLRLWTLDQDHGLIPFHPPEITAIDLAALALELALWGITEPEGLRWLDPPRPGPYQQARQLLHSLGAIKQSGHITATGKQLAALPIHPRLGHMLLMAKKMSQTRLACDLAALLTEKDILIRNSRQATADLQLRVQLLELWRRQGPAAVTKEGGTPDLCRRVDRLSAQWQRLVHGTNSAGDHEKIGSLLVYAYPDRIARRRTSQHGRYLLAGGRGARLGPGDPLAAEEYLVIPQLDAGHQEGQIFLAEALSLDTLQKDHNDLLGLVKEVTWDDRQQRVKAFETSRIGEIIISEKPWPEADPDQVIAAMMNGIRQMGIDSLPWDRESRQLQARVYWLRTWQPEANWPDMSDSHLVEDLSWLSPWLNGVVNREQLQKLKLPEILTAMLSWEQNQVLEKLAPTRITVPSGSKIRIDYHPSAQPLLAVRIQEMFGLSETPAICDGRVPLLLHLLSPAQRPIQVTADLAGFWQRSYPEIKKELKGRYPKHFWPDDPQNAKATNRVKRK